MLPGEITIVLGVLRISQVTLCMQQQWSLQANGVDLLNDFDPVNDEIEYWI